MVDLAVPRDIEPEVKSLEDVYLYTVDDLASVIQTGQAHRQAAVAEAEVIIDAGVQSFMHWMHQRGSVPLIQQLNAQADEWREAEMARARKLLAKGEDPEKVLEALSRGLTQKMLHGAMAELRSRSRTRGPSHSCRSTSFLAQRTLATIAQACAALRLTQCLLQFSQRLMKPFLRHQLERYAQRLEELDFCCRAKTSWPT